MCIPFIIDLTSCLLPVFLQTGKKAKHTRAQVWLPQRKKSLLTDHIWAIYSKLVLRIGMVAEYVLIFHTSFCSSENPSNYNFTSALPKTEMPAQPYLLFFIP